MASIVIDLSRKSEIDDKVAFTYADVKFPIDTNVQPQNYLRHYDANAIREALQNIFTWQTGERIRNPEFGNILTKFLYEGINETTTKNLGEATRRMLESDPRLKVESINVTPLPDQNQYEIVIQYSIPSLGITDAFSTIV